MKHNSKNRFNARHNNRGNRNQTIFRNTALDSNGPCGKLHGTALQLFEKYQAAAKDAIIQNDTILAETYLQFADHYMRLQNLAIENEEAQKASKKQQEHKPQETILTDEIPTFDIPQETIDIEQESEIIQPTPDMDLSVPVAVIQENHKEHALKRHRKQGAKQKNVPEVI